jgi:hypothetical protein
MSQATSANRSAIRSASLHDWSRSIAVVGLATLRELLANERNSARLRRKLQQDALQRAARHVKGSGGLALAEESRQASDHCQLVRIEKPFRFGRHARCSIG